MIPPEIMRGGLKPGVMMNALLILNPMRSSPVVLKQSAKTRRQNGYQTFANRIYVKIGMANTQTECIVNVTRKV